MNKKILFLVTESDWGGAQRFLLEYIPFLIKERGLDIIVATGGKGLILDEFKKQNITTQHIKHLSAEHFSPFKDIRAFFTIYTLIKKEQPDMLFLISTKAGFYGSIANFIFKLFHKKKPRVVYKIGGFAFTERINGLRKLAYLLIEKISAPFKDAIIVNSKNNFELALKKHICKKDKLHLIYNGINTKNFTGALRGKTEARKILKLQKTNKFVIGVIANFYHNKGLAILVDAIQRLYAHAPQLKKETICIVIGDGPERVILEEKIRLYKLQDNVLLPGAIPHAREYLNAFDVFVLPSIKEGFPWAVLEAMAAQLPIIATSVGGVPEMIQDHKNGILIPPSSPDALADALQKLVRNKDAREQYGAHARKAAQNFSLETMRQRYFEVILQALK